MRTPLATRRRGGRLGPVRCVCDRAGAREQAARDARGASACEADRQPRRRRVRRAAVGVEPVAPGEARRLLPLLGPRLPARGLRLVVPPAPRRDAPRRMRGRLSRAHRGDRRARRARAGRRAPTRAPAAQPHQHRRRVRHGRRPARRGRRALVGARHGVLDGRAGVGLSVRGDRVRVHVRRGVEHAPRAASPSWRRRGTQPPAASLWHRRSGWRWL